MKNMKNEKPLVLGLDVGTTGVKAIVTDRNGQVLGRGYREYGLMLRDGGRCVEQNAEDWYNGSVQAVRDACRDIQTENIRALSMSTQGASMLAVDAQMKPLIPVITWMDKRSDGEAARIADSLERETLYHKTGWNISSANDLPKLLWIKENLPEIWKSAHQFVSTLEYMNARLTGQSVTDPTNAAIRMLTDIRKGTYDSDILAYLGLSEGRLPRLQPAGALVGTLTATAAADFGLSPDTRVYNGAHDQYCASLGAGAVHFSDMMVATGTTWVVLGIGKEPVFTESGIAPGVHPLGDRYGALASLICAGSALKWYRGILGDNCDYAEIDRQAETRRESAQNLLFKPYITGVGFPHIGQNRQAGIEGLTINHDRYDIARALMEGVAFEVRCVLEEFEKAGYKTRVLNMTGRTAHSALWRSIVRDVTGCRILVTDEPDTGCMGAAMLAAAGLGLHKTLPDASEQMAKITITDEPDPDMMIFYTEKYKRYLRYAERQD